MQILEIENVLAAMPSVFNQMISEMYDYSYSKVLLNKKKQHTYNWNSFGYSYSLYKHDKDSNSQILNTIWSPFMTERNAAYKLWLSTKNTVKRNSDARVAVCKARISSYEWKFNITWQNVSWSVSISTMNHGINFFSSPAFGLCFNTTNGSGSANFKPIITSYCKFSFQYVQKQQYNSKIHTLKIYRQYVFSS